MFVPPFPHRRHRRQNRVTAVFGAVAGATAAITGAFISHSGRTLHLSSASFSYVVAGIIVALAIALLFRRLHTPDVDAGQSDAQTSGGSGQTSDQSASDATIDDRQQWLLIIVAIVAGLFGLAIFLGATPAPAASQDAPTQSAFILTRGADTVVVERISRSRASITGDLTIKGQARLIFTADVAAGPFVPSMTFRAWGAGADIESTPIQSGTQTMTADSAFIVVQTGAGERKVTKAISNKPLPLINNEFAMFELAIQRAKAQGGDKVTVPMFALSGGVQLDVTLSFVGKDSCVLSIVGQETRFGIDARGRITGAVLPSQNVIISRVDGAAVDKISIGRPDYDAPNGAPYVAEEVTVKTPAGHVLTGTLTIPKNAKGKVPAVVTITGSGQQDRDEYISLVPGYRLFRQVADTLGRRGIAVLRMDDRAINGSGGDVQNATSADFADDIRAGIAFLRARADIDGARIGLVGHSEGGMIAPLVASTDSKVTAIALMAGPAYTGRRIIDFQLKNGVMGAESIPAASKDSALKATKAEFDSTSGKLAWMKYFLDYDPVPTAKRVKVPVLIMQGATDQQVTADQAPVLEQAFRAGGNKDVTMKVFKDRNHLFLQDASGFPGGYVKLKDGHIDGEVMGTLADWFVAKLRP